MSKDRPRKEIDWNKKLKSKEWRQKVESEEWGAWKFVSDMLDNPNEYGIYPTSECYEKIHDFVVEAKTEAKIEVLEEVLEKERQSVCCDTQMENVEVYGVVGSSDIRQMLSNLKKKKK